MDDFHKELLTELIQKWDISEVEAYLIQLEQRRVKMDEWITHVRVIRKRKIRKPPEDTGARSGA